MPPYEGTSFLSPGVEQLHVTNCTYPYNESGNWKENIRCYNSKNHEESVFSPGKQEKLEGQNTLKSKVSLTATGLAVKEALREREREREFPTAQQNLYPWIFFCETFSAMCKAFQPLHLVTFITNVFIPCA